MYRIALIIGRHNNLNCIPNHDHGRNDKRPLLMEVDPELVS